MRMINFRFDPFLFLYLFMVTGSLYGLFSLGSVEGGIVTQKPGEYLTYQIAWLILYVVLFIRIVSRANGTISLFLTSGLFLAFLVSAICSYLINEPSATTLLKFCMYLMTIAFGAWLTTLDRVDDFFDAFLKVSVVVLLLHFSLYPIIGSTIVFDSLERLSMLNLPAYGGLFGHKAIAGEFFGVSILVCGLKAFDAKNKNKLIYIFLIILNSMALLLANAAAALFSLTATIILTFGIHLIIRRSVQLATVYWCVVGTAAVVIVVIGISDILALVGRDTAFTGRDFLVAVWPMFFFEQPLLGYGYAGFFTDADNSPAQQLWAMAQINERFGTFESSYLELGIQFGLIGGLLFGLIMVRGLVTSIQFAGKSEATYKYGPLALLIFLMLTSISQTSLLLFNYLPVVIVFWTYFGIESSFARRQLGFRTHSLNPVPDVPERNWRQVKR